MVSTPEEREQALIQFFDMMSDDDPATEGHFRVAYLKYSLIGRHGFPAPLATITGFAAILFTLFNNPRPASGATNTSLIATSIGLGLAGIVYGQIRQPSDITRTRHAVVIGIAYVLSTIALVVATISLIWDLSTIAALLFLAVVGIAGPLAGKGYIDNYRDARIWWKNRKASNEEESSAPQLPDQPADTE